jgi:hypothetical protein
MAVCGWTCMSSDSFPTHSCLRPSVISHGPPASFCRSVMGTLAPTLSTVSLFFDDTGAIAHYEHTAGTIIMRGWAGPFSMGLPLRTPAKSPVKHFRVLRRNYPINYRVVRTCPVPYPRSWFVTLNKKRNVPRLAFLPS